MSALAAFAGKYAPFVWPAYGIAALAFAWMVADSLGRARLWRSRARALEAAARTRPESPPPG
jgi:heme exporter protein D